MIEAEDAEDELLARARASDGRAVADLYRRHHRDAVQFARRITNREDAEDIVAESFVRVFTALRRGSGPTADFGSYLRTTIRRTSIDVGRQRTRVLPTFDVEGATGRDLVDDDANRLVERDLVRRAVARLPQRWRSVLWASEVEGRQPRQLAADFGVTPNGAAALAHRAREGFRDAYLVEIVERQSSDCTESALLAGYTRGRLSARQDATVRHHLDICDQCSDLAEAMADAHAGLRTALSTTLLAAAPLLLARRSWWAGLAATHGAVLKGVAAVAVVATTAGAGVAIARQVNEPVVVAEPNVVATTSISRDHVVTTAAAPITVPPPPPSTTSPTTTSTTTSTTTTTTTSSTTTTTTPPPVVTTASGPVSTKAPTTKRPSVTTVPSTPPLTVPPDEMIPATTPPPDSTIAPTTAPPATAPPTTEGCAVTVEVDGVTKCVAP